MIFFAYDGSINGDWVSHYATHLAARHARKTLHLIHVRDTTEGEAKLEKELVPVRAESERLGIELVVRIESLHGSVFESIASLVPAGSKSFLVCGTRVRERQRGLLRGSVAERSLRSGHCNVLAVRVVHPGLLGVPRRLLVPVSGDPHSLRPGLPFLKLFGPDVSHIHVLFVMRGGRWRVRWPSHDTAEPRRQSGEAYCRGSNRTSPRTWGGGTGHCGRPCRRVERHFKENRTNGQ